MRTLPLPPKSPKSPEYKHHNAESTWPQKPKVTTTNCGDQAAVETGRMQEGLLVILQLWHAGLGPKHKVELKKTALFAVTKTWNFTTEKNKTDTGN